MIDQTQYDTAMADYVLMLGQLGAGHPDTVESMTTALKLAPGSFAIDIAAKLNELGMLPAVDGYCDDNEPAFLVKNILAHLGIPPSEAAEALGVVAANMLDLGVTLDTCFVSKSKMHRRQ